MASGIPAGRLEIEIVAEIAKLQEDLRTVKSAVAGMADDVGRKTRAVNDNFTKLGGSTKLAAHQATNMAYQVQDLGVQFAMAAQSSHPFKMSLMAIVQQGPQIAMILRDANMSLGDFAKGLGSSTAAAARAHPVLAALAAAAVVAGGALAIFTDGINDERKAELDAYSHSLGLSEQELRKLGAASVSAMNLLQALHNVILKSAGLEKIYATIGRVISTVLGGAATAAKYAAAGLYAAFVGTAEGIKASWSFIPAALAEAAERAANLAIEAIEGLINKGITGINAMIRGLNSVLSTSISPLSNVDLPSIKVSHAGAGRQAGQAFVAAQQGALRSALSGMASFGKSVSDEAVRLAKEDFRELAEGKGYLDGDAGKAAGKKAGKKVGDGFAEALRDALASAQRDLAFWLAKFDDDAKAWSDLFNLHAEDDLVAHLSKLGDEGADFVAALNRAVEPSATLRANFAATASYLEAIGGDVGKMGAVLGALSSGDWSGLGNALGGKAGMLFDVIGNTSWQATDQSGERFTQTLKGVLSDVFAESGPFGKTLATVLQGAGTGSLVGGLFFNNNKAGQLGSAFGGGIGGAFAKGIGEKISSSIGGNLGKALGGIAKGIAPVLGGLLGGVIGSLFAKTPKASATIGAANGELSLGAVTGNSAARKAASTQGANSVIDALSRIADQLGAAIGSASVSVGMRKDSYVVDPTGQGRTKGPGVLNFGKDSEAAMKAAVQDAIADGVFTGLSAGIEKLLKGPGDIEKQLEKALGLQSVLAEARALEDAQAAQIEELDRWKAKMVAIATEAGEGMAAIEAVYAKKRADIAEEAAKAEFEKQRPYREIAIRILELEGKTAEATAAARALELEGMEAGLRPLYQRAWALQDENELAAKAAALAVQKHTLELQLLDDAGRLAATRADELSALDPSLHALQQLVWARADEAAAAEEAARIAEDAARAAEAIADERAGIEQQLLQLQGDTNALRAIELGKLDESNRALMSRVWALQDEQAAAAEATRQAEQAARALEDVAAAAAKLADQRRGMELQLLDLQGRGSEAEALRRADALAALDASLRGLQQAIWDQTDANVLAAAAEDALRVEREAAKTAADALAAAEKARADERYGLETQLLQLQGDTVALRARELDKLDPANRALQQYIWTLGEAQQAADLAAAAEKARADERMGLMRQVWQLTGDEAAIRADMLAQLDPANRALQEYVWGLEAAKTAAEQAAAAQAKAEADRAAAIEDARQRVVSAYEREKSALEGTIGRMRDFSGELARFREGLAGSVNPGLGRDAALARFLGTSAMAGLGDEKAQGAFIGDAQAYLDAAKANATSALEYQNAVALVAAKAGGAMQFANGMVSEAEQQIALMQQQIGGLAGIEEELMSFEDAMASYQQALASEAIPALSATVSDGLGAVTAKLEEQRQESADARSDDRTFMLTLLERVNSMEKILKLSSTGGALRVATADGESIDVRVVNAAAEPVPVDTTP